MRRGFDGRIVAGHMRLQELATCKSLAALVALEQQFRTKSGLLLFDDVLLLPAYRIVVVVERILYCALSTLVQREEIIGRKERAYQIDCRVSMRLVSR